MKISLCAIVRNDELLVLRMLNSAVGVVDEIVIADTGSTDGTVSVIESFMDEHPDLVRLLHFEWIGDFSKARNFTLESATGDWILVVDADEFLDSHEVEPLHEFLETTTADGIFITQRNYTGSMQNLGAVMDVDVVRLFRRGYTYEGRIHEQIAGDIQTRNGRFDKFKLHLHHVGYTDEYLKLKGKNTRNLTLLQDELAQTPHSNKQLRWFHISNLLAEYSNQHEWGTVASEARMLIEEIKKEKRKNFPGFTPRIYKFCVTGLRRSGRESDALRMCKEGVKFFPRNTDLRLMQAEILMAQSHYREAITALTKCRSIGDVKFDFVEYVEGNGTYVAAKLIARCWLSLGDDMTALEWFVKAFEENTEHSGIVPWIVLLTHDVRVLRELAKVIRTPQRFDEFIEYYAAAGHDDAVEYIEQAEAQWGIRVATVRARFAWEVRHGRTPSLSEDAHGADLVRMGLWYYERENPELAREYWGQAGAAGEYFLRILEGTSEELRWEIRNVFPELLATRAVRFLAHFGPYVADLQSVFPVILHTDLLAGFMGVAFRSRESGFTEEIEWKAQLSLSSGDTTKAAEILQDAHLPDGELSVRGYLIQADVVPAVDQAVVIRQARKTYPESKTLTTIWQARFASPLLVKGVVM